MQRFFQIILITLIFTGYSRSEGRLPSQSQIKEQQTVVEESGTTFYGGHLAEDNWVNRITLYNANDTTQQVDLSVYDEHGDVILSESYQVAPNSHVILVQTAFADYHGSGNEQLLNTANVGKAFKVETHADKMPVKISYQYEDTPSISEFFLNEDQGFEYLLVNPIVNHFDWLGMGVFNHHDTNVDVTFAAYKGGAAVAENSVTIFPRTKWVGLSSDMWEGIHYPDVDQIIVSSDFAIRAPFTISGNGEQDRHLFFSGLVTSPSEITAEPTAGYNCFFMGHSFFNPMAGRIEPYIEAAGFTEHVQQRFMSGGQSGTPSGLWDDTDGKPVRAEVQEIMDNGGIELLVMTFDPFSFDGYEKWIDYALRSNPLKKVAIGMFWLDFPESRTLEEARTYYQQAISMAHGHIDTLRTMYPSLEIYCLPYGEGATELRALYEADNLPGITSFIGPSESSIHTDEKGHAGEILLSQSCLIWLTAIYGVDVTNLDYDTGWQNDAQLKQIAVDIMAGQNPAYNSSDYNMAQKNKY